MEEITSVSLQIAQIAWVVPDITVAVNHFQNLLGIAHFSRPEISRAEDYKGTYYGNSSSAENLVAMTYHGGIFYETIQPLKGESIFKDYLDKHPSGGMQHIAYRIPVSELDDIIVQFNKKNHPIVSRFDTSWADIIFFDTYNELGVMTEIMGMTQEGEQAIRSIINKS